MFQRALQLQPTYSQFYDQYGQYLYLNGQKQKAIQIYLKGVKFGASQQYYYHLAKLSQNINNNEIAQYAYLMAIIMTFNQQKLYRYAQNYVRFLYKAQRYSLMINICNTYLRRRICQSCNYPYYIRSLIYCCKYIQAQQQINRAKQLYCKDNNFKLIQGILYHKKRQFKKSIQIFKSIAQQKQKQSVQALQKLGEFYINQKKLQQAQKCLLESLTLNLNYQRRSFQGYLLLAKLFQHKLQYQKAQKVYQQLLSIFQHNQRIHRNYAIFLINTGSTIKGFEQYQRALIAADAFHFNLYRAQMAKFQNDIQLYAYRLRKCLIIDQKSVQTHYLLAKFYYLEQISLKQAQKHYRLVIQIDKYYLEAYEPCIDILIRIKKFEDAEYMIEQLQKIDQTKLHPFIKINVFMKQQKYIRAEEQLSKIYIDKSFLNKKQLQQYYIWLGIIRKVTERYEEAGDHFLNCLIINNTNQIALRSYAQILVILEFKQKAHTYYQKLIQISPHINNLFSCVKFLFQEKKYEEVVMKCQAYFSRINKDKLDIADSQESNLEFLYLIYAQTHEKLGNTKQAQQIYNRCLFINRQNLQCKQKLANMLIKEGRIKQAQHYFYNNFNKANKNQKSLCKVCYTQQVQFINISCGHLCVCQDCAEKVNGKCPICRKNGDFKKVFL